MLLRNLGVLLGRSHRRRLGFVLVGILSAALLEMAAIAGVPTFVVLLNDPGRIVAALPAGMLRDWVVNVEDVDRTLISAVLLAGLFVVKNLYLAGVFYTEAALQRDVTTSVSSRLFRAYLFSPFTFHLQRNPAQLIRNTSIETGEAMKLIRSGLSITRESLVLSVVFLLLFIMDPLVSLSVFTLVGLAAGLFYLTVRRNLTRRGHLAQLHRGHQIQIVNQGLGAIKDAKILGREPYLADLFETETRSKEHQDLYQRVVQDLPRLVLEVAGVSALVVVAAVFVLLARPSHEMLPVLALLAVAVVRLVPAFNVITSSLSNIRYTRAPFNLICNELLDLETSNALHKRDGPNGERGVQFRNRITLNDLSFRYPEAAQDAVHGISLDIDFGKAVAFIGPSGAGKSTLVDLILGLLEPTSGEILIDGENIAECPAHWQRQIGYVPQDIYLLDDSIRRNIAFGILDAEINDVAIRRAMEVAQLDTFVDALPAGLDTVIGNRGARLSGGQRQRIGIARALYHKPRVLVMDEATSALDNETERTVIEAIGRVRGNYTIIMIAHRLTTVMTCDRLYLFGQGQVQDTGSYAELAHRHPHLRLPMGEGPPMLVAQ